MLPQQVKVTLYSGPSWCKAGIVVAFARQIFETRSVHAPSVETSPRAVMSDRNCDCGPDADAGTSAALGSVAESDKIYHVVAFGVLAFPMAYLRPRWLMLAVPAYLAFGGLIEILQPFVGRDRSLGDWLADLIGLGIGVVIGLAAGRFVPFARPRMRR